MSGLVICGDALQVMATMADASVDAIICDPPYEATRNPWDAIIPLEPMWAQLWRVCRGPVVLTAIQPFSSALVMSQTKFFRHEWVWEKNKATGHLNAKRAPLRAHEVALIFSKSAAPYFPQMTEGHAPMHDYVQTSNGSNYGSTNRPAGGGSTQRYPRSVQRFDIVNNDDPEKVHPTQKPVPLFEYLVRTYTQPGQLVLDFACGSGTTGVACIRNDRRFVGIELQDKYADFARARINPVDLDERDRQKVQEAVDWEMAFGSHGDKAA